MAARDTVLTLPELLENIILNLEWHQIIAVQRVSKQWQAITQGSAEIRDVTFKPKITAEISVAVTWTAEYDVPGWAEDVTDCYDSPDALLNPIAHHFLILPPTARVEFEENCSKGPEVGKEMPFQCLCVCREGILTSKTWLTTSCFCI